MKISKEARDCVAALDDALGFLTEIERPILAAAMQSLINSTLDRAAGVVRGMSGGNVPGMYHRGTAIDIAAAILALKEDTQ